MIAGRLVPADARHYPVRFTAAQAQRWGTVFPQGVCDWKAPGVGQSDRVPAGWPTFGA